jgi:small-conductance mechanosensitive channel
LSRASFSAPSARLRLLPVSDETAAYAQRWVRRLAIVIMIGYTLSQLGLLFGMDRATRLAVERLIGLVVHLMLIKIVLHSRRRVAARLGGAGSGMLGTLRRRVASVWHVYAILLIAGTWIVSAFGIEDGYARLLRFVVSIVLVGLGARILDIVVLGALDRSFAVPKTGSSLVARLEGRVQRYHRSLRFLLRTAIVATALALLLQLWGADVFGWFRRDALGSKLAGSVGTLAVTLGIAVLLWEAVNVGVQAYLDQLAEQGALLRAARLRTIVPLLRNALLVALMLLMLLTVLSEVGLNIGPLLAGASIFGVALGFGSQKLVQDFITGIFLLLENAMQVGDTVTAAGLSGTVEYLSIRTLRLRAGDGSVHLIPFSSVSTVTNANRGIGNAAVAVTVDYDEDTDRVGAVLAGIVTEMRGEEAFAAGIQSDLQLWGVDRVDGTTVTLAGQIVCTDGARWAVQREFNRRVKIAFQQQGIRMTPTIAVTGFRHPLDVRVERPPRGDAEPRPRDAALRDRPPSPDVGTETGTEPASGVPR